MVKNPVELQPVASKTADKPSTPKTTTSSTASTLKIPSSLKAFQKGIGAKKPESGQETNTINEVKPIQHLTIGEDAYSPEQFREYWVTFADNLRNNSKMLSATALSQLPDTHDNYRYLLKVSSLAIMEEVEKVKPELLHFLRTKLNNKHIALEISQDQAAGGRQLYTNREKLEYLIEQYPKLAELRDRLDLEADF